MEEETIASIVTNEVTNLTESSSTTVPEILITYLDDYEDEDDEDDDEVENITTNIINEFTTPKNETDTTVKVYVLPASRRPAYLQSF
jgi:hypothetical protein